MDMTTKMPRATRHDLVRHVASQIDLEAVGLTEADIEELIHMTFQGIVQLANDAPYLQIRGLGRFEMRHRKARVIPNTVEGEGPATVAARTVLWFTASPSLAVIK